MASFGEELKRERELRDISLKEISEATKISIRFLEALEQNDFDILPGGIFNRGFIRAYARFIGIDGEEMVNAYLHEVSLRESRQAAAARGGAAPSLSSGVFRPEKSGGHAPPAEEIPPPRKIALETRASSRSLSDLAEGRNSMVLWVIVIAAFLAGAGAIVISMMSGDGPDPTAEGLEQARKARLTRKAGQSAAESSGPAPLLAGQATPPAEAAAPAQTPEPEPARETGPEEGSGAVPPAAAEPGPAQAEPPGVAPAETPPEVIRHEVRVVASETTRVRIQCAGRVSLDQELWPGQTKTVACDEPVFVGADNAGAVTVSLDGAPGGVLGQLGERVQRRLLAPVEPPPAASPSSDPPAPQERPTDAGD